MAQKANTNNRKDVIPVPIRKKNKRTVKKIVLKHCAFTLCKTYDMNMLCSGKIADGVICCKCCQSVKTAVIQKHLRDLNTKTDMFYCVNCDNKICCECLQEMKRTGEWYLIPSIDQKTTCKNIFVEN